MDVDFSATVSEHLLHTRCTAYSDHCASSLTGHAKVRFRVQSCRAWPTSFYDAHCVDVVAQALSTEWLRSA